MDMPIRQLLLNKRLLTPNQAQDPIGAHFDRHRMFSIMDGLRDHFPRKLSHAGPRRFAYHDLS